MEDFLGLVVTTGHCVVKRKLSGREGLEGCPLSMERCYNKKVLKAKNCFTQRTGILRWSNSQVRSLAQCVFVDRFSLTRFCVAFTMKPFSLICFALPNGAVENDRKHLEVRISISLLYLWKCDHDENNGCLLCFIYHFSFLF